ncbi:MAG TPA: sigma-70 family RNA polymerase sigma factor [Actinomycetota bacterium]|nr:sigma-70 family RNA polymerase sigma factor [Actinomycetota bacterium]
MRIPDLEASTDEELVRGFVEHKDRDALEVLLKRHESRVYGLAYRILGNRNDALEATQETFLSVFRNIRKFRHQSAFATWLYRLTSNACYDIGRKLQRTPVPAEEVETTSSDRPDRVESAAGKIDIQRALGGLLLEQRTAMIMRDVYGLSYQEIAEATDAPLGTVKSRIARGREAMAHLLEPESAQARLSVEGGNS